MEPTKRYPDPAPRLGEPRWPGGLRPELPALPARIAALPRHRGYPVPWFVAWVGNGSEYGPEFRVADGDKQRLALAKGLCWVCGQTLERISAFVIGPMCAVNRISAEPPSHIGCAEFSARACPFLARPHMERREGGMPEGTADAPGISIRRNPGVALVWITREWRLVRAPGGGLIRMGAPSKVRAFAHGREATADELRASIESGLPQLRAIAEEDGPQAVRYLDEQTRAAYRLLGLKAAA
jgi:hypothetical protein